MKWTIKNCYDQIYYELSKMSEAYYSGDMFSATSHLIKAERLMDIYVTL